MSPILETLSTSYHTVGRANCNLLSDYPSHKSCNFVHITLQHYNLNVNGDCSILNCIGISESDDAPKAHISGMERAADC